MSVPLAVSSETGSTSSKTLLDGKQQEIGWMLGEPHAAINGHSCHSKLPLPF